MKPGKVERWRLLALLGLALGRPLCAASADLLSLPLEELAQLPVAVATGTPKALASAPASTTLLLPRDFQDMGARTVDEALAAVPGLHVAPQSGVLGASRYFFRGIASGPNAQALILINGVPATTALLGNSTPPLAGGMPLELVQRIEVIRGPGSALYGADAFAGVINIITRAAGQADAQAGLAGGSFDAVRSHAWLQRRLGPVQAALFLGYSGTEGDHGLVRADAQSVNDARDGTSASLAPGPVSRPEQRLDAYASLNGEQTEARLYWREVWDRGTNQGFGNALDPWGRLALRRLGGDLAWHGPRRGDWALEGQLAYVHTETRSEEPFRLLPPGAFGSFPQGLIDDFDLREDTARLQLSARYEGRAGHRLRLGAGLAWDDLYQTRNRTNYAYTMPGAPPVPRPGGLTDVSDTPAVLVPESARHGLFAFVQDEWQPAADWELTAGLRQDHYSDFGDVTTPRLALVWQATSTLTAKLLYGEAFRAPSFTELHATSNPLALGNPALRPERLRSGELGLAWRPNGQWSWESSLYEFHIRDFIDFLPAGPAPAPLMARNADRYRGRGLESELAWRRDDLRLTASLSLQETVDARSGEALGVAPRYRAYLRASRDLRQRWLLSAQVNRVGPRARQPGDAQPALAGYTDVVLTLQRQLPRAELFLTVRNLLNEALREPGLSPVPESLPLPPRQLTAGATVYW